MNILEDHRVLETLIHNISKDIENGEMDIDEYLLFEHRLKDHIFIEETEVFPRLKAMKELRDLVTGLKVEHGSFWILMDKIERYIEVKSYWKIPKTMNEILLIMHDHDIREEKHIDTYMLEMQIPDQVERPAGWTCERFSRSTK